LLSPALALATAVIVMLVLTVFVLPRFDVFLQSFDTRPPLPTRMLFTLTYFMDRSGWLIVAIIVCVGELLEHDIVVRFTRHFGPFAIAFLGVVLGFVAIGLGSGIYSVYNHTNM
jgi:type IV pilus assembly protein PilC